ncbi:MAG: hypothetical protein LIR40_04975 [Bacteroidota bacterium]|nr:hypothetical protein [Bacteroidota bacterium]HML71762.1 hypothetical protein [Macellibacteroides fermentans]
MMKPLHYKISTIKHIVSRCLIRNSIHRILIVELNFGNVKKVVMSVSTS